MLKEYDQFEFNEMRTQTSDPNAIHMCQRQVCNETLNRRCTVWAIIAEVLLSGIS